MQQLERRRRRQRALDVAAERLAGGQAQGGAQRLARRGPGTRSPGPGGTPRRRPGEVGRGPPARPPRRSGRARPGSRGPAGVIAAAHLQQHRHRLGRERPSSAPDRGTGRPAVRGGTRTRSRTSRAAARRQDPLDPAGASYRRRPRCRGRPTTSVRSPCSVERRHRGRRAVVHPQRDLGRSRPGRPAGGPAAPPGCRPRTARPEQRRGRVEQPEHAPGDLRGQAAAEGGRRRPAVRHERVAGDRAVDDLGVAGHDRRPPRTARSAARRRRDPGVPGRASASRDPPAGRAGGHGAATGWRGRRGRPTGWPPRRSRHRSRRRSSPRRRRDWRTRSARGRAGSVPEPGMAWT